MAPPPSKTGSLRLIETAPRPEDLDDPVTVDVPSDEIAPGVSLKDGVLQVEHDDGSTTIDFDPAPESKQESDEEFYENLVDDLSEQEQGDIASSLLDGIQRDIDSRKEWLETRARGIQLLGLKLEEPRGDMGTNSAPLEGQSTVRHPLLLEATIRFQATARGELLPAGGPVKVRNDTPQKPPSPPEGGAAALPVPPMGDEAEGAGLASPPAGAPQAPAPPVNPAQVAAPMATELAIPPTEERDSLAAALEMDMNHYLTVVATEYVKDTDRMLFAVGFSGDGFKKVFNCPLRRRPVSESVDAEDLIVSNSATDLQNCGRVTHRIKMRQSVVKRMQILGVYADVDLDMPAPETSNKSPVQEEKDEIEGVNPSARKPEDLDYEIYESYCELDLDQFAPSDLKGKGLPLPYRVTIEKTSRKILSVVRNWKQDDEQALSKQFFVQFPFIRGLGFYGLGFVHVLGNTTSSLTAMWREMLDAGMFANFPGMLYNKILGRQLSNQIRIPPGGGFPIEVGMGQRIQDMVMPMPYKEPGQGFVAFGQWVEQSGQRLGQTADISIGEGKQDAPVGTTLALIEQATKILDSVHKRLHWAQNEEFNLLKERFIEDPEAFWRHNNNKRPSGMKWEEKQFIKALHDYNLVPVADPNNPTSLHRTAKAAVIEGLAQKYPALINTKAAIERVFRVAGIDAEGLFHPQPLPPPPDPRMVAIQEKAKSTADTMRSQQETKVAATMSQMVIQMKQLEDKAADRESKEKLARMGHQLKALELQANQRNMQQEAGAEMVKRATEMHADQLERQQQMRIDQAERTQEMRTNMAERAHDLMASHVEKRAEMAHDAMGRQHELQMERQAAAREHDAEQEKHDREMARRDAEFNQKQRHTEEMHAAELKQARAMARIKPKSTTAKK